MVDPLQGKHIPVSPTEALELFTALANTLKNEYEGERLLFVGFAETATAIGAQVAISVGAKYIQTTREPISGVEYLFFSEEHSHATEQKLVKDDIDAVADETDRIIFVEDEVTTGKTILNIITILDRLYEGRFSYSVASLLNGMDETNLAIYADKKIRLHYLVKTNHSGYIDRAERYAGDGEYVVCSENNVASSLCLPGHMDTRRLVDAAVYSEACEGLWNDIRRSVFEGLAPKERTILVIGTEECMYPALYIGRELEKEGNTVRSHSTTRSPIAVSSEKDYPLHCRYELKSLYDSERRTFIYDIGEYDEVLVVTDADRCDADEGLATLLDAISRYNKKITVIRWC